MKSSLSLAFVIFAAAGCAASRTNAHAPAQPGRAAETRPTEIVATSGRVGLTSFALAGRVTAESARAVGGALHGLVTDGATGAESGWATGRARTREVARREAEIVKQAANVEP